MSGRIDPLDSRVFHRSIPLKNAGFMIKYVYCNDYNIIQTGDLGGYNYEY